MAVTRAGGIQSRRHFRKDQRKRRPIPPDPGGRRGGTPLPGAWEGGRRPGASDEEGGAFPGHGDDGVPEDAGGQGRPEAGGQREGGERNDADIGQRSDPADAVVAAGQQGTDPQLDREREENHAPGRPHGARRAPAGPLQRPRAGGGNPVADPLGDDFDSEAQAAAEAVPPSRPEEEPVRVSRVPSGRADGVPVLLDERGRGHHDRQDG